MRHSFEELVQRHKPLRTRTSLETGGTKPRSRLTAKETRAERKRDTTLKERETQGGLHSLISNDPSVERVTATQRRDTRRVKSVLCRPAITVDQ